MSKFINVTLFRENEEDERDIDSPIFVNVNLITRVRRTVKYATRIFMTDGTWLDVAESMVAMQKQLEMVE